MAEATGVRDTSKQPLGLAAAQGVELSSYEETLIERLFSKPTRIPRVFKAWLISYLETDPPDFLTAAPLARGAVVDWVGVGPAPLGYLLADGHSVRIASYTRLFEAIGTTFNTGNQPPGTFRLPNIQGGGQHIRKIIKT